MQWGLLVGLGATGLPTGPPTGPGWYSDTSIRKRLSNIYFEQPHFRADNCSFVYTCPSRRFELKEWDRV